MMRNWVVLVSSLFLSNVLLSTAFQFGQQTDNDAGSLGDIITKEVFDEMLILRDKPSICHAAGFYTYDDFIAAAKSYPAFASTGDLATRKREVAAFLAQTSYETAGEFKSDYQSIWGYCINKEKDCNQSYCRPDFPCFSDQSYCGRGPIQLSWNTNYGRFGQSIGRPFELLQNPDILIMNATMSFESAFWYWMTPQSNSTVSCHDVMVGSWKPSIIDTLLGRLPGYGATTNLLNGASECGKGRNEAGAARIGYYLRYCYMLGVDYGENLDCFNQTPFSSYVAVENSM